MANQISTPRQPFLYLLENTTPKATAWVRGNAHAPQLSGLVKFYETPYSGVLIEAEIFGLPNVGTPGSSLFYAMHIHEGGSCSGDFMSTGAHYDPAGRLHPAHAGDLLPILGNQGYAWTAFYDKRFSVDEIMGRTVIIHSLPDDFFSQPAGNSGERIGCGVIARS